MTRFRVRKKLKKFSAVSTFIALRAGRVATWQAQAVLLGSCAILASVTAISPAQAATVTQYTNRTDFTAASSFLTNIDFEGLADSGSFVYYPSGLTQSGVTFVDTVNRLFVVDPAFSQEFYDWGSGAILSGNDTDDTIIATLPTGITAIGSDIMSFGSYATDFLVSLSTGESFTVNSSNYPTRSFTGFISDTPIISISFKADSGYTNIDNFIFGQAANSQPVPEPLTILGSLAAGGVGAALRRKYKQQQKDTAKV
jgi:hypothetical protein